MMMMMMVCVRAHVYVHVPIYLTMATPVPDDLMTETAAEVQVKEHAHPRQFIRPPKRFEPETYPIDTIVLYLII